METTKIILVSNCCEAETNFCPPCLGEPGFYMCDKCSKETEVHGKEVVTHVKIAEGVYRPVENMEV